MGNSTGRMNVTHKSETEEKSTKDVHIKVEEASDKENTEPVDSKLNGDVEIKEHTNGHANGHANGVNHEADGVNHEADGVNHEANGVVAETETKAGGDTTQNVTISEQKKSNPFKWLKKSISFKKDKRPKKKEASIVEEPVESASDLKETETPEDVAGPSSVQTEVVAVEEHEANNEETTSSPAPCSTPAEESTAKPPSDVPADESTHTHPSESATQAETTDVPEEKSQLETTPVVEVQESTVVTSTEEAHVESTDQ